MENGQVKTVDISLQTLLRECLIKKELERDFYYSFRLANRKNINEIFKYKKFNEDFTDRLACYNTGENIVGIIRPSYSEFLEKLQIYLNVKPTTKDDDNLTKKLLERVEVLKNIKTEKELKKEFPLLLDDLYKGRNYINNINYFLSNENLSEESRKDLKDKSHYYYSCALKKSLPNFIESQTELYRRLITKRYELKKMQESRSYNKFINDNFDINKMYIYIIHEYLRKCETSSDKNEIKKYIKLIDKYLLSKKDKTVTITTDDKIVVDINSILTRFNNIKRKISEDSSEVDCILIPEGKEYKEVQTKEKEKKEIKLEQEEVRRLKSLGERKSTFYESTDYLVKAVGLRKYSGYVAYIYKNGEVILDRKYNKDYPTTASGDAIYNMKAINFEVLSKLDKVSLRKKKEVKRMIHRNNWEDRVRKIIEKEGTKEDIESAETLVKKLKGKSI